MRPPSLAALSLAAFALAPCDDAPRSSLSPPRAARRDLPDARALGALPRARRVGAPSPPRVPALAPAWEAGFTQPWAPPSLTGLYDVAAHAPPGFDPTRPFHLVVFLHGWGTNATGAVVGTPTEVYPGSAPTSGWGLGPRMDLAGVNALLVAPQFTHRARNQDRWFSQRGSFRAWLDRTLRETLAARVGRPLSLDQVEGVTLVAASAGGVALAEIMGESDIARRVRNVVLFDAFYAGERPIASWLLNGPRDRPRRLVALDCGGPATAQHNRALLSLVRGRVATAVYASRPLAQLARAHRVVIARSNVPHVNVSLAYFARALAALDLPALPPRPLRADPLARPPGLRVRPRALSVGEAVEGSLDWSDPRLANGAFADDYALDLSPDRPVSLRASRVVTRERGYGPVDLALRVLDRDRVVAESLGDESPSTSLRFTPPRAGRYTVRVTTFGPWHHAGRYRLQAAPAPRE